MIRSSACLAADDVSIRCRVRRSPFATNPQFGEAREMTCTMRNWHPVQPHHHHYSAAVVAPMMGHDISNNINNGNGGQQQHQEQQRSSSRSRGGMPPYLKQQQQQRNPLQSKTTIRGAAVQHTGGDYSCNNSGPELLMTPIHDILTNRDASPLRTKPPVVRKRTKSTESANSATAATGADYEQQHHESSSTLHQHRVHFTNNATTAAAAGDGSSSSTITLASFSIPLHDIVVVESKRPPVLHNYPHQVYSRGGRRNHYRHQHHHNHLLQQQQGHNKLLLTTMENGYLEFNCATSNGHDVLYAFLQASIPPERIVISADHHDTAAASGPEEDRSLPSKASSSVNSCSMDVDRLTAQQIQGAELLETWPQRFSRRVGKVVHTLTEVSETLCDNMANCCREANNGIGTNGNNTASSTTAGNGGGGRGVGGMNSPHYHHHVVTAENRDMPPPPPPSRTVIPSSSKRSRQRAAAAATAAGHGTTNTNTTSVGLEMVDDDVASLQSYYQSGTLSRNNYYHDNNNKQQQQQHDESSSLLLLAPVHVVQTNNNNHNNKHCSSSAAAAAAASTIRQSCHVPLSSPGSGLSFEQPDPAMETMYHTN